MQTRSKKSEISKRSVKKATKKADERKVEFEFYAPDATEVYLAGEFNQ